MKINYFLLILLASFTGTTFAEMYKQVDKSGNITYSNVPSQNAKEVDLPPLVVVPATKEKGVSEKIKGRIDAQNNQAQREAIKQQIFAEQNRLQAIKNEYKGGTPDRLGSERNYQRYIDRVGRLEREITLGEKNLESLNQTLKQMPKGTGR